MNIFFCIYVCVVNMSILVLYASVIYGCVCVFVWMCEDANEYIDADTFAYERLEAGIKVEGTRTTGITEFCTTASFDLKEILEVFV